MNTRNSSLACALALALAIALPRGASADPPPMLPAFFDPNAAASLAPLIVLQMSAPPRNNAVDHTSFPYGPITGSWFRNTMAMNRSSWTSQYPGQEHWITFWAYRSTHSPDGRPPEPNRVFPYIKDASGHIVWVEYTSVARANAATTAEILYTLGAPVSAWQAPLKAVGLPILPWETAAAAPATYFPRSTRDARGWAATDVFILPPAASIVRRAYAISLDYEVHDGRPVEGPDGARAFLNQMADLIHSQGKKAYLYTNPWDGPLMSGNGISPQLATDIITRWDYVSNLVYEHARSGSVGNEYEYGLRFFGLDRKPQFLKKIIVTYLLSNSDRSACVIHAKYQRDHFAGYMILPDLVPMGGADQYAPGSANLKLTELLFGHGAGPGCP